MLADAIAYERDGFTWLAFVDPSEDELRELRETWGVHEVACDGMRAKHERPTFEAYGDDGDLIVLRTAHYGADRRAHFGELAVFLGPTFVVTSRKGGAHAQGGARLMLEARPDLLCHGGAAVLWAILAKVVGDIRPVVDALDDDLIDLEEDVFSDADEDHTRRIFDLRQQVAQLYRAVHPMLGPLAEIELDADAPLRPHLREIGDQARLLHEDICAQRDRLTAVLEASLALIAHRQNQSVRKISGWAAIMAVPTLIAGVFGMNFQTIPGSSFGAGFPLCLGLMVAAALAVHTALRRARWL